MQLTRVALLTVPLVVLLTGNVTAQSIQTVSDLTVLDAQGSTVGSVVGIEDAPIVVLQIGERLVDLGVRRDGFESGFGLYFETADCSGSPYLFIDDDRSELLSASTVTAVGTTVYVQSEDIPQTITVRSERNTTGACQELGGFTTSVLPAVEIDLSPRFTPPFRLVSRTTTSSACCGDCNVDQTVTVDEVVTTVNRALNGCPAP